MKPEDLLLAETMPEDLRWVAAEYKLAPKDPVFLLIAWHWQRVKNAEDAFKLAEVNLKAALDSRVTAVEKSEQAAVKLEQTLAGLKEVLEQKPVMLSRQWDKELESALGRIKGAEASLSNLVRMAEQAIGKARRREILVGLVSGVALGLIAAAVLWFA